jgi:hypothetical protein
MKRFCVHRFINVHLRITYNNLLEDWYFVPLIADMVLFSRHFPVHVDLAR